MSGLRDNPYVGLRPFFVEDALYFFGREQQTAELLEILRDHRFLGVVGSSGSGKSSLVRAGLLPGLMGGFLVQDRDRWHIVQVKPGDAPISNLAVGLLKAMSVAPTSRAVAALETEIREGHTDGVVDFLASKMEGNANLFLLVDQFEEIFAFRGVDLEDGDQGANPDRRKERARRKAEASDFVNLMLALAEQRRLPVYVAMTMRSDFLGDCDLFYGLPEALNVGRYLVPRMTREQMRNAVECPARLLRAQIAPRLMDNLLNELGDRFDRLPVLQHALLRTWDEWKLEAAGGPIDLRHYKAAGGLEKALDQDAEGALQGLDLGVTARIFKRLTDTDLSQRRVRSPARISELVETAGADRATVEHIVRRFEEDGRSFVHPSDDGRPDDPRVDISHESLIRQWDRLRAWVDEERRSRDQYTELAARARKNEQGMAKVLEDPELQMAIDWEASTAPSEGWARRYASADGDYARTTRYLDTSVDLRCRALADAELQRRWRRFWNPLILVVVFFVATISISKIKGVAGVEREVRAAVAEVTSDVNRTPGPSAAPSTGDEASRAPAGLGPTSALLFGVIWKGLTSGIFLIPAMGLLAYLGLVEAGRRIHRAWRYPVILASVAASGGRSPTQQKVEAAVAALQDAVVAQQTTYAGTGRRALGFVIDWVCYLPFLLLAAVASPDSQTVTAVDLLVWLTMAWLYQTLQLTSKKQATWGMRAVGIFRTDLHGRRLSFARASAWYGLRLVSYAIYGLGFVCQPFTAKKQTLHDLLSKSVVLRRPSAAPAAAPLVPAPAGVAMR